MEDEWQCIMKDVCFSSTKRVVKSVVSRVVAQFKTMLHHPKEYEIQDQSARGYEIQLAKQSDHTIPGFCINYPESTPGPVSAPTLLVHAALDGPSEAKGRGRRRKRVVGVEAGQSDDLPLFEGAGGGAWVWAGVVVSVLV